MKDFQAKLKEFKMGTEEKQTFTEGNQNASEGKSKFIILIFQSLTRESGVFSRPARTQRRRREG